MGTRSTTYILDEDSHVLVCQYAQYDGYPEGVGKDLADILTGNKAEITSEFQATVKTPEGMDMVALANNGMECLAASLVKFRKEKPYGVYLYPVPFIRRLDFYTDGRVEIVGSLAEHARRNSSDYMYIIYHSKGTCLPNMLCYYLHEHDMSAGVQYDGPAYKFYEYLEEQKRKAEEQSAQSAELAAFAECSGFIEEIIMPEYEEVSNAD